MVLHPGDGGLLLFQQGVGNEVRHLKQAVVLGAPEGRASDDLLYGDVAGLLAVLPEVVAPRGTSRRLLTIIAERSDCHYSTSGEGTTQAEDYAP